MTQKSISTHSNENRLFPPPPALQKNAHIKSEREYQTLYDESLRDPRGFWARQATKHLTWFRKWDEVMSHDFESIGKTAKPYVQFFKGGQLNLTTNCLDRQIERGLAEKTAILWQGEDEREERRLTYREVFEATCCVANVLRQHGIQKGDTVTIFMPMIPEAAIAMLACARVGAIHSVVFSAFSPDALKMRIQDCESKMLITADASVHAGKEIPLKAKADEALKECASVRKVLVYKRGRGQVPMQRDRDFWWHQEVAKPATRKPCKPEIMDAEDPLFILYTSGSTGKPKGVLHTTAGYLLHAHVSLKWIFDIQPQDVYWCSADVGWITGHSYVVYGPLSNGITTVMFEGVPTFPKADRFWKIIERYRVNIFYTAPTAIRALMRLGDALPNASDLSSLRILGTVGEPINPEAWMWYQRVIGKERCPVVDTWWQTETGGIMITPLAAALATKPGSASKPFFGVVPQIMKPDGTQAAVNEGGSLVISEPWLGMIRGVYGDAKHELIKKVYFSQFKGKYFTGDGCRRDEDGFYWLLGRIDDVINVSAHRFATAEIESALVGHASVAEAAVVGFPHEIKGQGIYCFVTLKQGQAADESLQKSLKQVVRKQIGPIATPDRIQFAAALPKTRSGKIMRRILRKIAEGNLEAIGDTSTLADPNVVDELVKARS